MAIDTRIKNYPATHGKDGGGGGTTYVMGGGTSQIGGSVNLRNISAQQGTINNLSGKTLNYNEGNFIYIQAKNGNIAKLTGDELTYNWGKISEFEADNIKAGKISCDDLDAVKAWIETLNSKYITTEYLTVTKQAHFFELVIDKLKSVGGQIILTAANCIVDYAKAVKNKAVTTDTDAQGYSGTSNYYSDLDNANAAAYDIFFLANDATGRAVTNDWEVYDQAICQSFNNVSVGVNYDVANKYYWRLVTYILSDRYMNLNTGVTTTDPNVATVNTVHIDTPYIKTIDVAEEDPDEKVKEVNMGWNTIPQTIDQIITGAGWTADSGYGGENAVTKGKMTTTNTIFGIQMMPIADTALSVSIPTDFYMTSTSARLNIGFYYADGTSQYFPAPAQPQTSWHHELSTNAPIEAVVITNADEVEWHLVHGIRLSNDYANGECDEMLVASASIPSIGDNVVQLGYRYNEYNEDSPKYDIPRSSAIIIAAYQTPDKGEYINNEFVPGLVAPSYAQYTNITDFHLTRHRQTYIDATGAKFIGNLYVDGNTSVEDYVAEHAGGTVYLHVAYANSADGSTDFTKTPQAGVSYSYMGFCSNSNSSDTNLTYSDYEWSYIPGGTGTPGGRWQMAYKNATEQPSKPTDGTVIDATHSVNGWYATATTPDFAHGYYTWMSQCFVSGSTGTYGTWTTPIRITGDNGQDGEDGTTYEFIYTRNNTGVTPSTPTSVQQDDYVPTGWTDNPQGVSSNMMYEYVSQRQKQLGEWGNFTTPVIWSKWGENGMDGDGYEYIYKLTSNLTAPDAPATSQVDDYVPSGWTDNPTGPDTTYPYEWVCTRKKHNGTWGNFEPDPAALWATIMGPAGPQGAQGAPGPAGGETSIYKLIDMGSSATVDWSLDANNNMKQSFILTMKYKVIKTLGTTYKFMSYADLRDFPRQAGSTDGLYAYVKYTQDSGSSPTYRYYRMTLNSEAASGSSQTAIDAADGYFTYSYSTSSLSDVAADGVISNNSSVSVALLPYNTSDFLSTSDNLKYTFDKTELSVTVRPHAQFQVVQGDHSSISSLVTGQQGMQGHISQLYQDMYGIQSTVTGIQSNYVTQSQLTQSESALHSTITAEWQSAIDAKVEVVVDLKSGDPNRYFPVSISMDADPSGHRIVVDRTLDSSWGVPGWASHTNGFVVLLDWTTIGGGWGMNWQTDTPIGSSVNTDWTEEEVYSTTDRKDTYRFINDYYTDWSVTDYIAGSLRQNNFTCDEIVYLRGGSKYRIRTDYTSANITLHSGGYSWSKTENGIYYARSAPVLSSIVKPEPDQAKMSEIVQTIDNIQLNIYDNINNKTGIDVSSGTITLDAANTYVNGNLQLNSTDQGFIVKGPQGMAIMTPNPLGGLSNFINEANFTEYIKYNGNNGAWTSANYYETSWSFEYAIGQLNANSTITLANQVCNFSYNNGSYSASPSYTTVTYEAYIGSSQTGNTVTSREASASSVGTISLNSGGFITLHVTVAAGFSRTTLNSNGYDNSRGINCNMSVDALHPKDGVFTKIGADGLAVKLLNNRYIYADSYQCYIDYGLGGLRIESTGIRKRSPIGETINGNDVWCPLSTLRHKLLDNSVVITENYPYELDPRDELLTVPATRSNPVYILLPQPGTTGAWEGRIIYVKNLSGQSCNIKHNGYLVYRNSSESATDPYSISKISEAFICNGTVWIEYFCG